MNILNLIPNWLNHLIMYIYEINTCLVILFAIGSNYYSINIKKFIKHLILPTTLFFEK